MNRSQIYLDADQTAAWQAQWRDALEKTAGVAPYLGEGIEYVEEIRRVDAERLSRSGQGPARSLSETPDG